jgi:hypothetical protein
MGGRYSPNIVTSGLVLCLDAANVRSYSGSGTSWSDLSGLGNTFTITGATYNSAGYFSFNGTSQYMSCASPSFSLTNKATVSVWLKPGSGQGDGTYNGLFSYGPRTCAGSTLLMSMNSSYGPTMAKWCDDFTSPSTNMNTTSWWNYTLVLNGTSVAFYLNGTGAGSGTVGSTNIGSGTAAIGSTDLYGRLFKGDITLVSLYNNALSAAEVSQNFNALRERFGI